jgi:CubicO group peptidase (beta-lactamase class C family)
MRIPVRAIPLSALFLLAVMIHPGHGQPGSAGELAKRVDAYLTDLSPFGFSGAVSLIKDGRVVLRKGYGESDEGRHIPNTSRTVFDIGSLAKQFTAVAVLRLEGRKKLALTDPIDRYLPFVPADKKTVTIEQLLTHTSGLDADFPLGPEYAENYYEPVGREEAIRRILGTELVDRPGHGFSYSNQGYVLLAAIVEKVAGRPFNDVLKSEIFGPAGMRSTGFWGDGLPAVDRSLVAKGYDENGERLDPAGLSPDVWSDKGGGQVVSTVEDLEKWWAAVRDRKLLTKAQTERMFTPRQGTYGYAWNILKRNGRTVIEHGGDYLGFGSQLAWYRDDGAVMIILSNRTNHVLGTRHVAGRIAGQMIMGSPAFQMFHEGDFEFPPPSEPVEPGVRRRVSGTYRLASGGLVVIRERNARLEVGAVGQDAINAISLAPDADMKNRSLLNRAAQSVMNGLIDQDPAPLAKWLQPGKKADVWFADLRPWLSEFERRNGFVSAELVGTAPGGFPVGVQSTLMQLRGENAKDDFQIDWLDNGIVHLGAAPDLAAVTWLNKAKDGRPALVGWNILTFKGFEIGFDDPPAGVKRLRIIGHSKEFTATRID